MLDLSFLGEGEVADAKRKILQQYFFIQDDSAINNPDFFLRNLAAF